MRDRLAEGRPGGENFHAGDGSSSLGPGSGLRRRRLPLRGSRGLLRGKPLLASALAPSLVLPGSGRLEQRPASLSSPLRALSADEARTVCPAARPSRFMGVAGWGPACPALLQLARSPARQANLDGRADSFPPAPELFSGQRLLFFSPCRSAPVLIFDFAGANLQLSSLGIGAGKGGEKSRIWWANSFC